MKHIFSIDKKLMKIVTFITITQLLNYSEFTYFFISVVVSQCRIVKSQCGEIETWIKVYDPFERSCYC